GLPPLHLCVNVSRQAAVIISRRSVQIFFKGSSRKVRRATRFSPSEETSRPPATERPSSFAALRHRDFRLMWMGQFVSITGSQMQLVTINWHVYLLTHSAAALGLV